MLKESDKKSLIILKHNRLRQKKTKRKENNTKKIRHKLTNHEDINKHFNHHYSVNKSLYFAVSQFQ